MQKEPFVSIIIPCRVIDSYTNKCLKECLNLDYTNYDIILLPDKIEKIKIKSKKIKVIPTGAIKPAVKRNLAMKKTKAEIYAFIDSDAYPIKSWLKEAVKELLNKEVGMIGGPNLTPKNATIEEKVSGIILSKWIAGGRTSIRYKIDKRQETIELPSCNFIVKKGVAGNFESDILTAEDSKFCFNVTKKGKKIIYSPKVIVYHHRRKIFLEHFKQMWIYGRDIAYLIKREGNFSFGKMYYSILSVFLLGLIFGGLASLFNQFIAKAYISALSIYLLTILFTSLNKNLKITPLIFLGIIGTHISYGMGFLYGLLTKPSKELNRR